MVIKITDSPVKNATKNTFSLLLIQTHDDATPYCNNHYVYKYIFPGHKYNCTITF